VTSELALILILI